MSLLSEQPGDDGLAAMLAEGAVVGCDRCRVAAAAVESECCGESLCLDCWGEHEGLCEDCFLEEAEEDVRPVVDVQVAHDLL